MGKSHASRHLGPGDKVSDVSVSTKIDLSTYFGHQLGAV